MKAFLDASLRALKPLPGSSIEVYELAMTRDQIELYKNSDDFAWIKKAVEEEKSETTFRHDLVTKHVKLLPDNKGIWRCISDPMVSSGRRSMINSMYDYIHFPVAKLLSRRL